MVALDKMQAVQWLAACPKVDIPKLANQNVKFYKKCIVGPLTLCLGDYVLVLNADTADPDTINNCDIAKILYLYELQGESELDPCRAIVQWYSKPEDIPHREFDSDDICIDFGVEVIEDHRPYDNDISLESIFRTCFIVYGSEEDTAAKLLRNNSRKRKSSPTFVCRYKLTKSKHGAYRLSSLYPAQPPKDNMNSNSSNNNNKHGQNHEKVSPIKIVGGRSVVRSSSSASTSTKGQVSRKSLGNKGSSSSPSVCRNLNLNLENNNNNDPLDIPEYSIVETVKYKDDNNVNVGVKIKLRRSSSSTQLPISADEAHANAISIDSDRANLPGIREETDFTTPTKKARMLDDNEAESQQQQPTQRRKSILKSSSRIDDGTPKRNIQLSNIVEKRVFQDDDIICTPKRASSARKRNSEVKTRKSTGGGTVTPSFSSRRSCGSSEQRQEDPNDFQLARAQLHVSVIPKSLPCRENEFDNIYTFLEGKIQDQYGGCMYVSGVPGTGKTATTTSVIRMLQENAAQNKLPPFEYVEINGMRLTEPRQAYVQIYKQLTGKTVSSEHAHALLEKRFTTPAPRRIPTLLLVDELDILCNRRQDVVYNLLDWPTKAAARLIVITIANTMDLPERLLMGKVTSRLGLTRLTFQPYTYKQLQEIVTQRLEDSDVFKCEAVQLVARKVAAVSGDARRALDICRRATEIAETCKDPSTNEKRVSIQHVQQALAEMIASAKVQVIKNCSNLEQIFLQAVATEATRTGVEEVSFLGVYTQIKTIATFMGVKVPPPGRALHICAKLGSKKLLICEHSRTDIHQKILLNVSTDDIHYALRVDNV